MMILALFLGKHRGVTDYITLAVNFVKCLWNLILSQVQLRVELTKSKIALTLSVPVSYQQPISPYITHTKYDIW